MDQAKTVLEGLSKTVLLVNTVITNKPIHLTSHSTIMLFNVQWVIIMTRWDRKSVQSVKLAIIVHIVDSSR